MAIERIPWLLNGSLEAPEREEIRRHLKDCADCRLALAETQSAWEIFDQHLPTEALVALAYDEQPAGVSPEEAWRHLAACARCASELEMARTSRRLEEEENVLPFAPRRAQAAPAASVVRSADRRWQFSAIAAGLAGVVFFAAWIHSGQQVRSLRSQLAAGAPAPAAGPLLVATGEPVSLEPAEAKTRALNEAEATLPAGRGSALELIGDAGIEPAERAAISSYRVEVWRADGAKVSESPVYYQDGIYSLTVRSLPPGSYELRIFGTTSEGAKACETYPFKVGA